MKELSIIHDGKNWVAGNGEISFSAPTLDELDVQVAEHVRTSEALQRGEKREVRMYFNNAVIPQWIRQYAQHYFNRIIVVEG